MYVNFEPEGTPKYRLALSNNLILVYKKKGSKNVENTIYFQYPGLFICNCFLH